MSPPTGGAPAGAAPPPPISDLSGRLARQIRDVPDHPRPGVVFKDITPVLADGPLFADVVDALAAPFHQAVDTVVAVEARGFIFGAPVAVALAAGFVPVRKAGKLPGVTIAEDYQLEYGTDRLELLHGALQRSQRVLVVDDILATGGTLAATLRLIERAGATVVAVAALIELTALGGRANLPGVTIHALHVA